MDLNFTEQQQDFLNLQDEYTTSDLFMRRMHSNGISYDIIKRRLPIINDEVSKAKNITLLYHSFKQEKKFTKFTLIITFNNRVRCRSIS